MAAPPRPNARQAALLAAIGAVVLLGAVVGIWAAVAQTGHERVAHPHASPAA